MSCPMKQNECQLLNAIITQPEHLRVTVIEQRIRAQGVEHLNDNDASSQDS